MQAIADAYAQGETDEFVQPRVMVDEAGHPVGRLEDGDCVIFFNFRSDRARQITRALADDAFDGFDRGPAHPRVDVATMTQYDEDFLLPAAFPPQPMNDKLSDVLTAHGLASFRTAETEKYPHVTYFFNGGVEDPPPARTAAWSPPRVPTYDQQPEMSAPDVTRGLVDAIRSEKYASLVCNYANPDMVGHTGVMAAAVRGGGGGGRGAGRGAAGLPRHGHDAAGDGGPRQLRADVGPGDQRPSHGAHHQPAWASSSWSRRGGARRAVSRTAPCATWRRPSWACWASRSRRR